MDMMTWIERGYTLEGTKARGVWIAHRQDKGYCVLKEDFWGDLQNASHWTFDKADVLREAHLVAHTHVS